MQELSTVLIVTAQSTLWLRCQSLRQHGWEPVRGVDLQDLARWKQSGRQLAILDADLPQRPAWHEPVWGPYFQDVRVLVVSPGVSDEEGQKVLSQGACGYASAEVDVEAMARVLWSLQQGHIWMGRSLLQKLLQDIDQRLPPVAESSPWAALLSVRETEVALLASKGHSNADIATALSITERTVRAHLSSVFEKLAVSDRLQLSLKVHGIKK